MVRHELNLSNLEEECRTKFGGNWQFGKKTFSVKGKLKESMRGSSSLD